MDDAAYSQLIEMLELGTAWIPCHDHGGVLMLHGTDSDGAWLNIELHDDGPQFHRAWPVQRCEQEGPPVMVEPSVN